MDFQYGTLIRFTNLDTGISVSRFYKSSFKTDPMVLFSRYLSKCEYFEQPCHYKVEIAKITDECFKRMDRVHECNDCGYQFVPRVTQYLFEHLEVIEDYNPHCPQCHGDFINKDLIYKERKYE